ncbi:MAG: DMT family transporter [Sedimentisphaerales bacterium]|nr:DMT family transporter [Sedimentisphaerales bacterium]
MFIKNEKLKGAAFMVSACAMFGVMASLVKLVSHIDAFMIGLWRFVIGMALVAAAAFSGIIQLRFNNRRLLLVRGLLGGAGIVMTYFAIIKLGMSKGMVLVSTYPIFACIFSVILLKEKPSVVSSIAIAAAFAGIFLVAGGNNGAAGIFENFGFYEILAVCVGLIGGIVIVAIRKLHQTDNSYSIYFSQCAVGFLIAIVPASRGFSRVGLTDGLILVLIGITATIGQLMMTQSYKYLPVRIGATLAMLEPVFCYIGGVALFGEFVSAKSVIGTLLIIGSCVAVVLHGYRSQQSGLQSVGG